MLVLRVVQLALSQKRSSTPVHAVGHAGEAGMRPVDPRCNIAHKYTCCKLRQIRNNRSAALPMRQTSLRAPPCTGLPSPCTRRRRALHCVGAGAVAGDQRRAALRAPRAAAALAAA